MGMAYFDSKEYDKAKQYLFRALNLNSDTALIYLIHFNLGRTYERKSMVDSAIYFAELSLADFEKRKNIHSLVADYKFLSKLEEKKHNYMIANVTGWKTQTVAQNKTNIREKLGVGKRDNIALFIAGKLMSEREKSQQ
jgi:tetratricopeptide (TPR) repeat protein